MKGKKIIVFGGGLYALRNMWLDVANYGIEVCTYLPLFFVKCTHDLFA
jgi:hypothetical protein